MIVVMKAGSTPADMDRVLARIHALDLDTNVSRGVQRTVIGVIGPEEKLARLDLSATPGIEKIIRVLKPFKLASREFHPEDTVVDVRGVKVGAGQFSVIAGPCAVESRERLFEIARQVRQSGAVMLRGGAFKPRTSPYSFQGLGEAGLRYLRECGDELHMPVVTEVMDTRQVELVARYADVLQIGARNMQNFSLLMEVGKLKKPVILKRGMSSTVQELLMSAEYILSEGNSQVILCERGIKTFETSVRNTVDISAVPNVKGLSHLPILVDPSHGTGRYDLVSPMSRAALAAGADGVLVEVHSCPEEALCDGAQSLRPERFDGMMKELRGIAGVLGIKMAPPGH
jgi:3-deoxy-7-phosphoheptulonate synthase